jgi:hypothetical protein
MALKCQVWQFEPIAIEPNQISLSSESLSEAIATEANPITVAADSYFRATATEPIRQRLPASSPVTIL